MLKLRTLDNEPALVMADQVDLGGRSGTNTPSPTSLLKEQR